MCRSNAYCISSDESKIVDIKNMKTPTNTKDVERFLGLVTYFGKFIQNIFEKTASLRLL